MESISNPGKKATNASFPAKTLQASGAVDGVVTDVTTVYFSDKIMVTISQGWRLAQWIQVPLLDTSPVYTPGSAPHEVADDESLLPMAHLTPKTLLGAGASERETMGHLIATQIASVVKTRDPDEARTLVVGMGLKRINLDSGDEQRAAWMDLVDLVTGCSRDNINAQLALEGKPAISSGRLQEKHLWISRLATNWSLPPWPTNDDYYGFNRRTCSSSFDFPLNSPNSQLDVMAFGILIPRSPIALGLGLGVGTFLATHHARRSHQSLSAYCDGGPTGSLKSSDWSYSRTAKTPVKSSSRLNPTAVRQISSGSVAGLLAGLAVSTFSRPLTLLLGIFIAAAQWAASNGYNIIPYRRIHHYVQGIDLRSAVEDNAAFKLSFGLVFALSAFAPV